MAADPALDAARARLERLFASFDRLTPDELARVGYRMPADEERDALLDEVDRAARETGRVELVDAAREAARDAVMRRYAAGALHPTFAGLNWGLSQGRVEDRVGIAETLADAAAAEAVRDGLDPEVADALALDAAAIVGLAAGEASEGSFDRVVRRPGLARRRARQVRPATAAVAGGVAGFVLLGGSGAGVGALLAVAALEAVRRRRRGP